MFEPPRLRKTKLRARVTRATGEISHGTTAIVSRVEIEAGNAGFFLFHYDSAGNCVADTWHPTLAEAQSQATLEYRLGEADWTEING